MTEEMPRTQVQAAYARLKRWLLEAAYPLWFSKGVDRARGGFHEGLTPSGDPLEAPRRARVQARQVFAFSQAPSLGWNVGTAATVVLGVEYFLACYKRPDGLFRTVVSSDGTPLDDSALLYDQAFALLALASALAADRGTVDCALEARQLWSTLQKHLKRRGAGFDRDESRTAPLCSNPHMHLFESTLAWSRARGGAWKERADALGELALASLIDPATGWAHEYFGADWRPLPGLEGRVVEPGHQYEWAWLLLSWDSGQRVSVRNSALRLIELGERHGVHRGVAVNALLDDGSLHDENARLWPQTERLRAAALAARLTGDPRYWQIALSAADGLLRYLATPCEGLWFDSLQSSGQFASAPANAGTLYHIVGAIMELGNLVGDGAAHAISPRPAMGR